MTDETQDPTDQSDQSDRTNPTDLPADAPPAEVTTTGTLQPDPPPPETATPPADEPPPETPSQTFARRLRELRAELTAKNISIEIFREAEAIAADEFKASQPKPFGLEEPPKSEAAAAE